MPILIGLFIMPIGILLLCFGMMISIWKMLPGHEILEPKISTFEDQYIESSTILTLIFGKRSKQNHDFKE
jgi:hypothetical protein